MNARLMEMLKYQMPILMSRVSLAGTRPGLIVVDEVNGFCTVGMGNLAPKKFDASIADMVTVSNWLACMFAANYYPI